MKPIVVKKFGGAGLSSIEKVRKTAESILQSHQQGQQVIAVVSAMGKTTDQLIAKAYEISPRPDRRELDMLISTGERVSMALLTMALKDMGCDAISFTGSQAGVLTDNSHGFASIVEVKPIRVEASLNENKVVVIAGFQGVDPATKEITTLGRGGTDTTAVAFAGHFKAERCEIVKEVDGIYTADPNLIDDAQRIPCIDYSSLLHMSQWGAKALHHRSVELAKKLSVPVWVGALEKPLEGTLCSSQGSGRGMNVLENIFYMECKDTSATYQQLCEDFFERGWRQPLVVLESDGRIWMQADLPVHDCVSDWVRQGPADSVSDHGYQCLTFSGFHPKAPIANAQWTISTESGEHHFLKQPMDRVSLNQTYRQFVAPHLTH